MPLDANLPSNTPEDAGQPGDSVWEREAVWVEPGVHRTLDVVARDVIESLRRLAAATDAAVAELPSGATETDRYSLMHTISGDEQIAFTRGNIYALMAAICCEESLNRFSYFNLPADVSAIIERLKPTEKLLIIAAFLGESDIKSSHVYGELKRIMDFRNRFAHGHNPGMPMKSLRANHATLPTADQISTIRDEVKFLRETTVACRNVVSWLREKGTHPITAQDWWQHDVDRFLLTLGCFELVDHRLPPDSEGREYFVTRFDVDEETLTRLLTDSEV